MNAPHPIDKARWPTLSPLLDELLDLEAPARAARLAQLRAEDASLAADLEALLAGEDASQHAEFLAAPALSALASATTQDLTPGQTLGAYTLEREIGRGGMGSVWLARRTDGRFEGQVAIKFLSDGLLGHGDAGRFAREGQILARLAHPNIARLLDAGVAPDGRQPYLVLEYIDGQAIDVYCRERDLDTTARVRLFLDVLAAVAHAHNRLILHRDLKPSNILVTGAGEVKLLDFGIAKLLDKSGSTVPGGPAADDMTELTKRAGRVFTPQYAAPEQVQDGDVTTATDVYALGVLLYMLLSGEHPTAGAATEPTPLGRLRAVVEAEPKKLSEAVRVAHGNGKRSRELRGDLDTIVAKALKKAPGERYANAAALSDDLRRWLADEPIQARPDGRLYVAAKFVRRHRIGVATTAGATLALAAGLGVALFESREAQYQRAQAEGMVEFMLGDLRKKLEPVGRLDVMDAVGEKALSYYAALETGRQDPDSLGRRARAMHLMGEIAEKRGKLDEADKMFREAAASTGELLARAPEDGQRVFDHAQSVYWVGFVARRRGQAGEAERQFKEYMALANRLVKLDPEKPEWRVEQAYAGQNLGVLLLGEGRIQEALQRFEATRSIWVRLVEVRPALRSDLGTTLGWLSRTYRQLGAFAAAIEAEQAKLDNLDRTPDALGNRRAQELRASSIHEISRLQLALGQVEAAFKSAEQAIRLHEALARFDDSNLDWLARLSTARLGMVEIMQARHSVAELDALFKLLDVDIRRLLDAEAGKLEWLINLQGRLVHLEAFLALAKGSTSTPQSLLRFLDSIDGLSATGKTLSQEQVRIVASAELLLGDLLAGRDSARAASRWRAASERLMPQIARGDLPAMTLSALAQQRLGRNQEARALADKIEASAYRHPRYGELRHAIGMSSI